LGAAPERGGTQHRDRARVNGAAPNTGIAARPEPHSAILPTL